MKRAFTLIELLVYMAIMGFIIVVAGRAFSDSTSMRVRSQNLLKSSSEIGKLANLLSEDISQMGVKVWGRTTEDGYEVIVHNSVYMDAENIVENKRDSSSYILTGKPPGRIEAAFADSLIFRKAVFDANGKFIAVREITWYAKGDSLFRKCREVTNKYPDGSDADGDSDNDCNNDTPVLIAINITNFKLTPSTPTKDTTLFPSSSSNNFSLHSRNDGNNIQPVTSINNSQTQTELKGFMQNDGNTNYKHELYLAPETGVNWNDCAKLNFNKNNFYAIEFGMRYKEGDPSTQFVPGKDHLSIGLRKEDGTTIAGAPSDMFFYPPQETTADNITRHFEFVAKQDIEDACVAITAAFYSPAAWDEATLSFRNFKVFQKVDESFNFPEPSDANYNPKYGIVPDDIVAEAVKIKEKRGVKAFELIVEMTIGKEERKAGTFSQKNKGIIIATPNNGVVMETE